jgi:AMP nucleosidase
MQDTTPLPLLTPDAPPAEAFTDAARAVDRLEALYTQATEFLTRAFSESVMQGHPGARIRAFYPEIRLTVRTFDKTDSRLSFGHVSAPGTYSTTVTRPDLFRNYLIQQLSLLIQNHGEPVVIGASETPIPVHFAVAGRPDVTIPHEGVLDFSIRDIFDVPDLATTNDDIVNGTRIRNPDGSRPLAPFTAQRVDYSLARLSHYTATDPDHFQNYVLFTNYQFYVEEFETIARAMLADPASGYTAFVAPGNSVITAADQPLAPSTKTPQMPTYHLKRADGNGITLVNIGVGPSNAKTATDHIAVLRPHAWLMVGHCAGLRNSQSLGDFCLAHAYLREDHVLDDDLPIWVPIPALAEIPDRAGRRGRGRDPAGRLRAQAHHAHRHRGHHRQPQLGTARPVRPRPPPVAVARHRAGHGKRHHRRQRFPLPRALRHAPLRQRQTPAWRAEAARHGIGVLPHPGVAPPADRRARHGIVAPAAIGTHPQPQTPQLRGNSLPVMWRHLAQSTRYLG